jgi:hypothetical protein
MCSICGIPYLGLYNAQDFAQILYLSRRCVHYKQEQYVSLFPRPENTNKTQYI